MTTKSEPTIKPCRMVQGHFIPGCWGGVLDGKRACTCIRVSDGSRIDKLEAKVSRLMEQVRELRNHKEKL